MLGASAIWDVRQEHALYAFNPFIAYRSMDALEMVRVIAETHLATVALCRCVTSGVQVAVKMYHKERLMGKMKKQVFAFGASSSYRIITNVHPHWGCSD